MVFINWRIFTREWLKRAERGEEYIDDGDRFISLWIAFNGWMRAKFGEGINDRSQINALKGMPDFKNTFEDMKVKDPDFKKNLDELENKSVVDMRFRNECEDIYKYDGTFESLLEVIYQVRCNLFHGRKNLEENKKDFELVSLSHSILLPLFKAFLNAHPLRYT